MSCSPMSDPGAAPPELAHRHFLFDLSCQDCHPQGMDDLVREIVVTLKGSYVEPLPRRKWSKEACLACHGDYLSLATATAGLDVNPHDTHLGEEECRQCHTMHEASPGMKFCRTCHHTGELVDCGDCHEDRQVTWFHFVPGYSPFPAIQSRLTHKSVRSGPNTHGR